MINFLIRTNNVLLYSLLFSIVFENLDPFGLVGVFSIAKMISILYILSWIPFLPLLRSVKTHIYIFPLLGYLFIETFSSAINNSYLISFSSVANFKFIQLIIIILLVSSHVILNQNSIRKLINLYIASISLLSILFVLGIGTGDSFERVLILGENPNMVGMKVSIAIMFIFDRVMNIKNSNFFQKFVYFSLLILLFNLLIATASRGALLSVFLSLMLISFLKKMSFSRRIFMSIFFVLMSSILLVYIIQTNEYFGMRISATLDDGDIGRSEIWDASIRIIKSHFFIGVGNGGLFHFMNKYIGAERDTHNLFLYILVTSGLFGFFFFMTFIFRLGKNLFRQYSYSGNIIFPIFYLILLFFMFKQGGALNKTFIWFSFAFLMGVSLINLKKIEI